MTPATGTFVYILTSDGGGYYEEMAAVSARTLRNTTPGARIVMLSDRQTQALTSPAIAILKDLADGWIACDIDRPSPVERSRWLKVNCRNLLDGPFVFLDTDTLIARDISGLFNQKNDFAAARDAVASVDQRLVDFAAKKNWSIPAPYLNSGVFYANDTPEVRKLFETAYGIWQETSANGLLSDQFVINLAIKRLDFPITWLSPSYNLQLQARAGAAFKPHIYHVYTYEFENRDNTILHVIAKKLKHDGQMDEDLLDVFFKTRNPWINAAEPGELWALGRPVSAVLAKLRKSVSQTVNH